MKLNPTADTTRSAPRWLPDTIRTAEDHRSAWAILGQAFPEKLLSVALRNVAHFEVDRWRRHPDGGALLGTLGGEHTPDSWDGIRTIFGFSFPERSCLLDELGQYKSHFPYLVVDIVDARIEVVFERLELLNYRRPSKNPAEG